MVWSEWKYKWLRLHGEWQSNWEKYDINDSKFDDNLIAVYDFHNHVSNQYVLEEIGIAGGRKTPCAYFNVKADQYGEYNGLVRIHYRCPDLPLVIKICESFGGELVFWDSSKLERPPNDGGVYVRNETNSSGEGCYIATVCYGSYNCPQVITFRNFRDTYLNKTFAGRTFIKIYYALSPLIAEWLKNKNRINAFIRVNILERIYNLLRRKAYS